MVLLVVAYNRPHYVKRCLNALSKMRGIEDCKVLFQADGGGGCDSIREAYEWEACPISIMLNKANLGCNGNIQAGLRWAFSESDRAGIIEDDVEVSQDWLEFVKRPEFYTHTVCTFQKHEIPPYPNMEGWGLTDEFCPWGWVTHQGIFTKMMELWPSIPPAVSWDSHMFRNLFKKQPPSIVYPKVGRSFNFGKIGTYCSNEEDYYKHNYTPYWAGKMI